MLFAVLSASDILDVGLVRSASNRLASVQTVNLDHLFTLVASRNLAFTVDHRFTLNDTLLSDASVTSSDLVRLTNDSSALSVDESLTSSAWLSDTGLLLEVVVFSSLTGRNAVSSAELVSWLAGSLLADLSVPGGVWTASVDASRSNWLSVWWTGLLDAVTVLLDVTFLAGKLETGSLHQGVSWLTLDSSASSTDELEVSWAVDFEARVTSSDLTSWAGNLSANVLTVDKLSLVSSWALNSVADTVLSDLSALALSGRNFFHLVAFVSDNLVSVRTSNGVLDDLLDALVTSELESSWASSQNSVVSLGALEAILDPSSWTVLNTGSVLVVGVTSWAVVGDLPLLLPLGVVVVPDIFELLSGDVDGLTLNGPTVLHTFLGQVLPAWVVLDDILNRPLVPVIVLSNPKLVPSEVRSLVLDSPRSSGNSPSSEVSVVSDSSDSRPSLSKSESLIEFDVGDLSSGRPSLVSQDPSDVSSVLGVLVLSDVLGSGNSDVSVTVNGVEVTSLGSPSLQRPLSTVVESGSDLVDSPSSGVSNSSLNNSVLLVVSNVSPGSSDGDVSSLVLSDDSSLHNSDSSSSSSESSVSPSDSVGSPSSTSDSSLDELVSSSVRESISPSLVDNPSSLASSDTDSSLGTSPGFTVEFDDRVSSSENSDSESVTSLGLDSDSSHNSDGSGSSPSSSSSQSSSSSESSSQKSQSESSSVKSDSSEGGSSSENSSSSSSSDSEGSSSSRESQSSEVSSSGDSDTSVSELRVSSVESDLQRGSSLSDASSNSSSDDSDVSSDASSSDNTNVLSEVSSDSLSSDNSSVDTSVNSSVNSSVDSLVRSGLPSSSLSR